MWILVMDTSTRQLMEAPAVSALTDFDDLGDDFPVWCANGDGEAVVIPRRNLVRI